MATDWTSKQGDSAPVLADTLTYNDDTPVDLTGAALSFVARALAGATPLTLTGLTTSPSPTTGAIQFSPTTADTAAAGLYMSNWVVILPGGAKMTFPTSGYNSWSIEENLSTVGGQQLVGLPDVKEYCNIPARDRTLDEKLVRIIHAVRPVVEHITGPIIPQIFEEWHDGGQCFVQVRRRPSTGYGTTPILDLMGCDEYRGPIKYSLAVIADPAAGGIYSVHMDRLGKITRRTTGGGVVAFPSMPESVHIWYRAGQSSVPANVYEGTLELIRVNYETTQAVGRGRRTVADEESAQPPSLAFYVPRRVRELLSPTKRAPAIA